MAEGVPVAKQEGGNGVTVSHGGAPVSDPARRGLGLQGAGSETGAPARLRLTGCEKVRRR